ncbi:MAG TPA: XdhC family protein [Chloroflexota bacterium]|nr:XdhC family protein [Chloroflexota bacterium]
MPADILDHALQLRTSHQAFALATVVVALPPTSATPSARAIILPDGKLIGWIGGSCAQETVVSQALEALAQGEPRLVVLSPDQPSGRGKSRVVELPMTCASQGELQIYVEPFVPKAQLAVVGSSPVAVALARLGSLLDFEVLACDPAASEEAFPEADQLVTELRHLEARLTARSYVVVATIGQYDEDALRAALSTPASYVGLVASRRRLAAAVEYLRGRGLGTETLARVRRPEGLKAKTVLPAEIAFSVMAELLQVRREHAGLAVPAAKAAEPADQAVDPICGMAVSASQARYRIERDGQTYYFCCAGCQAKFEAA